MLAYTDWRPYAERLNAALRKDDATDIERDFAALLVSAVRRLPKVRGRLFRGIRVRDPAALLEHYGIGEIVTWNAFTSTSRESSEAFAGNVGFEIHSKTGRSLLGYSAHEGESEVLFLPGALFRVIDRYQSERFRVMIVLEEVISA